MSLICEITVDRGKVVVLNFLSKDSLVRLSPGEALRLALLLQQTAREVLIKRITDYEDGRARRG